MAASGLITPRLDYARRMTDYAVKMFDIVDLFNQRHQTQLALAIGIDAGEVMAGIVGKHKFVYDIWGEVVNDANRTSHEAESSMLCITKSVYSQLTNQELFHQGDNDIYMLKHDEKKS